jgi:hypothetical protein
MARASHKVVRDVTIAARSSPLLTLSRFFHTRGFAENAAIARNGLAEAPFIFKS